MKYLGIDYGTKKIGLAVSDQEGKIAFPKKLIKNDQDCIQKLTQYIKDEAIDAIVIGKSLSLSGELNKVQRDIDRFKKKLKEIFDGEIFEEDERMTSVAAKTFLYGKGNIANEHWTGKQNKKRRDPVDPAAASIILQRFLDRKKAE